MTPLEIAKQALPLPDLMARLGLREHAKKSARCPFHEDRSNSFSVFQSESGEWAWNCFAGCGGGDVAAFIARVEGISNGEACRRLIQISGARIAAGKRVEIHATIQPSLSVSSPPNPLEIYSPTDNDRQLAMRMIERLRDDRELCQRIGQARHWQSETIRGLALEGYLGWDEGKLAFIYDTGIKLRWRANGERMIRWAFGKPWLWRGAFLNFASTVYLCEGETDVISLIDAGIESAERTVAVALPSASTFDRSWAESFKGKEVILAFDHDNAGAMATRRVSELLSPQVQSLKQLQWKGVQYAS